MSTQEDLMRDLRQMQDRITETLLALQNGSGQSAAANPSNEHYATVACVGQSGASVNGTPRPNLVESSIFTSTDRSLAFPPGLPLTSNLCRSGTSSLRPSSSNHTFGVGPIQLDTSAAITSPSVPSPGTSFAENIANYQRARTTPGLPMFRGLSGNSRKIAKPKPLQLVKKIPTPVKMTSRTFYCMNEPGPQAVSDHMLEELETMGLGRKDIAIDNNATSDDVKRAIQSRYPIELSWVPWRLTKRIQGGPVPRMLLAIDPEHDIPSMEKIRNTSSKKDFRLYIQPKFSVFEQVSDVESETSETNHSVGGMQENLLSRSQSPQSTCSLPRSRSSTPDRDFSPFVEEMEQQPITLVLSDNLTSPEASSSVENTIVESPLGERCSSSDLSGESVDLYQQEMRSIETAIALSLVENDSQTFRSGKDLSRKFNIKLNRETLLQDTLSNLRTQSFDVIRTPVVEFVGEAGQDAGALLKEWLWKGHQLLAEGVWRGANIFDGSENHRVPSYDCNLLKDGIFEAVARFGVLSFLHLNMGLPYLSRSCVDYFLTDNYNFSSDIEIHNNDLSGEAREAVKLIRRMKSGEELSTEERMEMVKVADTAGYRSTVNQLTADDAIDVISRYDVINRRQFQLDAMKKVFNETGVLDYLKHNRNQERKAFPLIEDLLPPVPELLDMIIPCPTDGEVPELVDTACKWIKEFIVRHEKEPAGLQNLLCAWTGSGLMPSQKVKLRVYMGTKFEFHACFGKLEIPADLTKKLFRRYVEEAMLPAAGFHLV